MKSHISQEQRITQYQINISKTVISLLFILITSTIAPKAFGQLSPISNEYIINPYLINPAYAGIDKSSQIKITNRMQWVGLDDAPRTQSFSYDMRIKAIGRYNHSGKVLRKSGIPRSGRVGLGVYLLNDMNNPFKRTGVQISYAYHLPFKYGEAGQLSFGVSAALFQHHINSVNFHPSDINDPALSGKENIFTPNLSLGVNYIYKNFFVSLSAIHLYPAKINHYNESMETVKSQIYLYSGYKIIYKSDYSLTPSILFKSNPQSIEVSAKFSVKDKINFVLAWESNESSYFFFYFRNKRYLFGYSFDYSMSEVKYYNDGTHLISFGYIFN